MEFKLDHSKIDEVKNGIQPLIQWTKDNIRHSTIKVNPRTMLDTLEVLTGALEDIRTLQQQNKQLVEALEFYADIGVRFENGDWDVGEHAREVIQSIRGDTA